MMIKWKVIARACFHIVHVHPFDSECENPNEIKKNIFCHNKGWLELRNASNLWAVYSISNRRVLCLYDTCTYMIQCSKGVQLHYHGNCIEKEIGFSTFSCLYMHHDYLFFLVKKMTKEILFVIHSFNKCIHRTNRYHEYC